MRISEIKIDDSQTGDYWVQILVGNQKQAFSLREQILKDQATRERLEKEIESCKHIAANSTKSLEIMMHNFVLEKLEAILGDSMNFTDGSA